MRHLAWVTSLGYAVIVTACIGCKRDRRETSPGPQDAGIEAAGDANVMVDAGETTWPSPHPAGEHRDCASSGADGGSAEPVDTDGDGAPDWCDDDDDQDGFLDADDPAPLDAEAPGDFSTPEAILAHPLMREALEAARSSGIDVPTHLGTEPPDLSGYYVQGDGEGSFVLTDNSADNNRRSAGAESRQTVSMGAFVRSSSVMFTGGTPVGYSVGEDSLLRGQDPAYSIYSRSKTTCTEGSINHDMYMVSVTSGTVEQETGHLLDVWTVGVTVDASSDPPAQCIERYVGTIERQGGWFVGAVPKVSKVQPSALRYMCVDVQGYAPTETWTSGAETCRCNQSFEIECR